MGEVDRIASTILDDEAIKRCLVICAYEKIYFLNLLFTDPHFTCARFCNLLFLIAVAVEQELWSKNTNRFPIAIDHV